MTHLLGMMWASGATCGLMGLYFADALEDGLIARSAGWLAAIGFVLISIDALYALVVHNPVSAFSSSALPFSNIIQIIPLIGWVVLTILVLSAKRWTGWSRFAPLATLLAPFVGLLLGGLLGVVFLPVAIMGLRVLVLGIAVQNHLNQKRRLMSELSAG